MTGILDRLARARGARVKFSLVVATIIENSKI